MIIIGRSPNIETCFQNPQGFLLIGYLTEYTWILRFRIRYIDTKHQIEDILTKGHVTRDEWNNLLCLFNMSHFSSLCCAKNFSLNSCTERMAKRMQEQSKENRIVAKSRPTAMNLTSSVAAISSSANSPIASRSTEVLKASSRQVGSSFERLRCEHNNVGYIHVCHTSNCSSSWTRLFIELTIRQESIFKVCGEIISDNWEVDQRTDRSQDCPRLTGTSLRGESHLCCVIEKFELWNPKPVFSDSVLCLGGFSPKPVQAWKDKMKWYLKTRYPKELDRIDRDTMEFNWKFSKDSRHWNFKDHLHVHVKGHYMENSNVATYAKSSH